MVQILLLLYYRSKLEKIKPVCPIHMQKNNTANPLEYEKYVSRTSDKMKMKYCKYFSVSILTDSRICTAIVNMQQCQVVGNC